jgi:hypothetical protein
MGAAWLIASRVRVSDTVREILWKSALLGGIVTLRTVQTAVAVSHSVGSYALHPAPPGPRLPAVRVAVPSDAPDAPSRLVVMRAAGDSLEQRRW